MAIQLAQKNSRHDERRIGRVAPRLGIGVYRCQLRQPEQQARHDAGKQ